MEGGLRRADLPFGTLPLHRSAFGTVANAQVCDYGGAQCSTGSSSPISAITLN